MWEERAILYVAPVEFGGAASGIGSEGHVFRGIEALVAGTVELTAETPGLVVVQPCSVSLEMQDQPQFEAGVGHGEVDVVRASLLDGFPEPWMIPRPLHIEYAPELIDLRLLFDGPAAGVDRHGH
jgi:hypothetical protein